MSAEPDALDRHRWVTVGESSGPDPHAAGLAAARQAVRGAADCRLLVVFCSARHEPQAILAGIAEAGAGIPLIGCSSASVIGPGGSSGERPTVVVVGFGGPGFDVATGMAADASADQRAAGGAVAACARQVTGRAYRILLMFTDGLMPAQEEVLAGAYGVVGASLPLVGGSSSPDHDIPGTFHLFGERVVRGGVVGAAIGSDGPLAIAVEHGWRRVGDPMIVTGSAGVRVMTLDDTPAMAAYLRRLGAPDEAYVDPVAFERFAERRPLGIRRRSGLEVRNVGSSRYHGAGWLHSSGDVPENGLVWPMEGDEDSVIGAADTACREAVRRLGTRPPLALLAFDCETRARFLTAGGRREEVAVMARHAGDAPLAGLYTWGEIARTRGINGFYNQTLVVLAVG